MNVRDTIVAIATPFARSGLGGAPLGKPEPRNRYTYPAIRSSAALA